MFQIGEQYTRAAVQEELDVPENRRGGDWDTGYTNYNSELYVFCNVGSTGRTGHDYPNRWDGEDLIWSAKNHSKASQPLMLAIASGALPVHVFHRSADRAPFVYAGMARATDIRDTSPVVIRWSFSEVLATIPRKVTAEAISKELAALGFRLSQQKKTIWNATRGSRTVYIKPNNQYYVLVIDPSFEDRVTELEKISGVHRPNTLFYHNSNMREFPQRIWTGKRPIPYGIDFGFTSIEALHSLMNVLDGAPPVPNTAKDNMDVDPRTETEVMRAVRLGQQNFRRDLLDIWNGRCALTDLAFPELLRASHIKPWCDCEPKERLDPDNGLLLAVHIDGLFDRGLISFDGTGRILLSDRLNDDHLRCFGISAGLKMDKLTAGHHQYLKHHRARHGFRER